MYQNFKTKVLQSHERLGKTGKPTSFPTPSKSSPGDCNFIVTGASEAQDSDSDVHETLETFEDLASHISNEDIANSEISIDNQNNLVLNLNKFVSTVLSDVPEITSSSIVRTSNILLDTLSKDDYTITVDSPAIGTAICSPEVISVPSTDMLTLNSDITPTSNTVSISGDCLPTHTLNTQKMFTIVKPVQSKVCSGDYLVYVYFNCLLFQKGLLSQYLNMSLRCN